MSKLAVKLLLVTLILTGAGLLVSGSHVSAASVQCDGAPFSGWGNHDGEGNGTLASLIVETRYDTGEDFNATFTLNSELPGSADNNRIFHWPLGSGSTNSKPFTTGETLTGNASGGIACTGWSVLGTGVDENNVGNGWVIDCGNGFNKTNYWISGLNNPGGQAGTWELIGDNGTTITNDVQHTDKNLQFFTAKNGGNVYIKLIFHPEGWRLSAQTTVDNQSGTINKKPGETVTFRHTITNNGPQTANYSWKVQDDSTGAFANHGLPTGSETGIGDGASVPNAREDRYRIPDGAQNGETYCERIYYTHSRGSGNSDSNDANSAKACVRVQKNPDTNGGGTQKYGCSQTTITTDHVNGTLVYVGVSGTDSDGSHPVGVVERNGNRYNDLDLHYTATSAQVKVDVHTYTRAADGSWPEDAGSPTSLTFDCYHATCYLDDIIDADNRSIHDGGIVQAGKPFKVRLKFWNDNAVAHPSSAQTIPENAAGYLFSMTEVKGGDYIRHPVGFSLNPGTAPPDAGTLEIPQTASGSPANYDLNFYPAMDNGDGGELPHNIGNGPSGAQYCTANITVYQEFNASAVPWAKLKPTKENPTDGADYNGKINITGTSHAIQFPAGTTATFYKQPAPGGGGPTTLAGPASDGIHSQGSPYLLGSATSNYPSLGGINAGDKFCTDMTVTPTHGYVGPGNEIVGGTGSDPQISCDNVVNRPYAHFFGNDVSAGGGFGSNLSCHADQKGTIYTYTNRTGPPASAAASGGTGAQFGAQAMSVISGLSSASLRASNPTGVSGLSFANTEHIGDSSTPSQTTGGYLGTANNLCVPDYFTDDKPSSLTSADTSNGPLTPGTAGAQWYNPGGTRTGTLTLNAGTIPNGTNQAIFVEGNVNITGNITYDSAARTSVTQIPSFYLIVKGGNIHIDPDVKQLDGVYIAQPDTSSPAKLNKTGIINTCYVSNPNDIYNLCKNQLVINGAFVANRVLLTRSYSSLRYSQGDEYYVPITTTTQPQHSCGNVNYDVPSPATASAADCASEVFNFSPELYMSQPAINARFGGSSGKFDAITNLSPVL